LNEEDKFDTFIRELPQVKRLYEEKEMLMASNKSLAEYNLSQVPYLSVLLIVTSPCIKGIGRFFWLSIGQCCGSGIRCLFDPWIRDPGWVKSQDPDPGSGMNNPNHIS
jgi:hypothetical protein